MFYKKMTLMLALLTAVVAGAAQAGDFKIYGKLHTSIDMLSDSDESQMFLSSNTSRFGLKGAQELNENFSFIWQFEQKLNLAQKGAETLANRNTFIGLTGEWGTFLAGIHDTPFKTLGRRATFFFDEIGDIRTTTMGWDRRIEDVVLYVSPNFEGLGFSAAYQFDQGDKFFPIDPDNYEAASTLSANAMYNRDGLLVGVAVESLFRGFSEMWSVDVTDPLNPVDIFEGYGESQTGVRAAAKYTMDKLALAFLYQSLSNVGGVDGKSATTMGGEARYQFDPKFAFKGSYHLADPNTDLDDDDFAQMALGVDHTFAKNLSFYMQYAMVMNADDSDHGLGGSWHGNSVGASAPGQSPNGFSVGSWFRF